MNGTPYDVVEKNWCDVTISGNGAFDVGSRCGLGKRRRHQRPERFGGGRLKIFEVPMFEKLYEKRFIRGELTKGENFIDLNNSSTETDIMFNIT